MLLCCTLLGELTYFLIETFIVMMFTQKSLHNLTPVSFGICFLSTTLIYGLRNTNNKLQLPGSLRTEHLKCSFSYSGVVLWKSTLPPNLRQCDLLGDYKKKAKAPVP